MSLELKKIIDVYFDQTDRSRLFLLPLMVFASNAKIVVELGTCGGASTEVILEACKIVGANLYTCDLEIVKTWNGKVLGDILTKYGDICTFVHGDSVEFGKKWNDGEIDLLYIDTKHTQEHTKEELTVWESHVRIGGWIVLHDTHEGSVKVAIRDFLSSRNDKYFYFDCIDNKHGIGFMRKLS